jgi:pyridoxal biosynthesis lyase PdxS
MAEIGTLRVKTGLAEMLKGGVIMDVVDAEQARIAEDAGACAVMALERVPADIRRDGGVARMCVSALTMSPVPASPFVRIIAAPSAMRRRASPRFVQPHTNGTVNACLST